MAAVATAGALDNSDKNEFDKYEADFSVLDETTRGIEEESVEEDSDEVSEGITPTPKKSAN